MRSCLLLLLAACGSTAATPVVATKPIERVSCSDAAKILRGYVTSEDPAAGPARESAIERACTGDGWSRAVLDCVGTARPPASCIAKLDDAQRDSYQAKVDTWDAQYSVAPDPVDVPPPVATVNCAVLPLEKFTPALDAKSPELDWQLKQRASLIGDACNQDWNEQEKECIATGDLDTCMHIGVGFQPLLTKLLELDALATKIAAARTQPRSIACEKVVAAHYGNARWANRLTGDKDRAKQIARSKKAMQDACGAEHWSEPQRACLVVANEQRCFASTSAAQRWSYPALALANPKLPLECQLYGAIVERFVACTAIPQKARTALKAGFDQMAIQWASMPADELQSIGAACRLAGDGLIPAFPACSAW